MATKEQLEEAGKKFKELAESLSDIKKKAEQSRKEYLKTFNIGKEEKFIAEKVDELRSSELILESLLNKGNRSDKMELYGALAGVRQNLHFFVTLAYMKRQDRLNNSLLLLSSGIANSSSSPKTGAQLRGRRSILKIFSAST